MAFSSLPTVNSGDSWTASQHNTYLRDNFAQCWPYTTAGDMMYAATSNTSSRLGITNGGVMIGGASAPSWLAPSTEYLSLRMNSGGTAPAWESMQFASVYHNTTQTAATGTPTALAFNSEYSDTPGWHSTSVNTSRITVGNTGYYMAIATFAYAGAGGSGNYYDTIDLKVSGTVVAEDRRYWEIGAMGKLFSVAFFASATASQYFEIFLEQNSGGTRTVSANATFSVVRIA